MNYLNGVESQEFDASKGRLPLTLSPSHYDLKIQPFINGNRSIHGDLKILFMVNQPTNQFIINIKDIITKNETSKVGVKTNTS